MRAVALAAALSCGAQAQTPAQPAAAPQAAALPQAGALAQADAAEIRRRVDATGRRGFLYEAIRGNQRLYLYGTSNSSKTEFFPLNNAVMQALAASSAMLVEVDYTRLDAAASNKIAGSLGSLPPGDTLQRRISPEMAQRLQQVAASLGVAYQNLQQANPWLVSVVLANEQLGRLGYDPGQNTALYLLGYAKSRQMPVLEMEGYARQLKLLADAPPDAQADFLDQTMRDIASGRAAQKQQLLVDQGWALGRSAGIERYNGLEIASGGAWADFYRTQVLAGRSRNMAEIAERAAANGAPFVAAQAINFFGSGGMLAELQRRGFAVRDLQPE